MIIKHLKSKSNSVWCVVTAIMTGLVLWLAGYALAEDKVSRVEYVIQQCNKALIDKDWETWGKCNQYTADQAKAAMDSIQKDLEVLTANQFEGKLVSYKYGEYKVEQIRNDTSAYVSHELSIVFNKGGALYRYSWRALMGAVVDVDSLYLGLIMFYVSNEGPTSVGSSL